MTVAGLSRPAEGRPHVLYVAWGFPPMAGGGTYRTLATANILAEVGFDVTVLTTERRAFLGFTGVDDSLVDEIDPRVRVHRIPFSDPTTDFDIREWPAERVRDPKAWLQKLVAEGPPFPEPRFGHWLQPLLQAAEQIHRARPVDLVIGSANPHVVLSAGDHLHRRFGVPYVIDHRDAWRLNCYSGTEAGRDIPQIAELETRYMNGATEIWFVNEQIRQWHQAMYPDDAERMHVVENGYDVAFAPTPQLAGPAADAPLVFSYVGTISSRVPLTEFIEGWARGRRVSDDLAGATARIFGPLPANDASKARLLATARHHGVEYHGPVSKADVAGVYESSDVLLLLIAGGRFVTSGKVYEYLASGLPIVSVHEPDNGAGEVLRDYPLWFPARDLTVDGVRAALLAAAEAARSATTEVRRSSVERGLDSERHAQLRPHLLRLRSLLSSAQGVGA